MRAIRAAGALALLLTSSPAWAVQEHVGRESFYLHQLAHLFFVASMVLLVALLRRSFATASLGWKRVMYAALLLLLWNVVVLVLHVLEDRLRLQGRFAGARLQMGDLSAAGFYLGSLFENALLALAFVFLALGLSSLRRTTAGSRA